MKEIKEIYTPIEEAGEIIRKRWADEKLRKAVEEKLEGDIPEILKDGPVGLIWRCICTPDGEFKRFLDLCEKAKVKPTSFENIQDRFFHGNFTKHALVNLPFFDHMEKNLTIVEKQKIIDFHNTEKRRLHELKTLWGESLVDFHHFFMKKMFPIMENKTFDISEWLERRGKAPKKYYSSVLSLAICHAIYFDDYDVIESEAEFVKSIILPAFEEVEKYFGVSPIIIKVSKPEIYKKDPYWWCYPKEAKLIIDEHIKVFKTQIWSINRFKTFIKLWKFIPQLKKPGK